jgi:starch phosphorylase
MSEPTVAYFSMEIGLQADIPTYSGGLGVLAGDMIRAAADAKIPMVAMSLLHRRGYFSQVLDASGWQTERNDPWPVDKFLKEMPPRVAVMVEGRRVALRAWRYDVKGVSGHVVPVYLLDSDLAENAEWDRTLTHFLYGGDNHYRLCQELLLGMGGVKMLRALGHRSIERFHLNEGHASLLALELLDECARAAGRGLFNHADVEQVRRRCVFTTHTPVPAGHDQFPLDLVGRVLGRTDLFAMKEVFCCDGVLNLTYFALNLSHYVNGVAKKHGEITQLMFARYSIDSITNGVHAATWAAPSFQELFDRHIPGWREDNTSLRNAISIPKQAVWRAHLTAKEKLIAQVNRQTGAGMNADTLTLGFARRAATYKRGDLLFRDIERLRSLVSSATPLQLVFAGKAHPRDQGGKELIQRIYRARDTLKHDIKIAFLDNYDMTLGGLVTAGVDVWLNTPQPPLEASGTSGMKAALNGVPSLSVLDGWWIEGCIEGVTGWAIGSRAESRPPAQDQSAADAASLYDKLERVVLPLFYRDWDKFLDVMRHAIALNGSHFNTQRMLQQYVVKAYFT